MKIQDKLPPEGAQFAYRWIVPQAGRRRPLDHYLFLDADQKELGSTEQPTTYDPRTAAVVSQRRRGAARR